MASPASGAQSREHMNYFVTDPSPSEIAAIAKLHAEEIADVVGDVGAEATKTIPFPPLVSKAKYVRRGIGAGAAAGAGVGALAASVVPGLGTTAGAGVGAVVGGTSGGIIGYRIAVKINSIANRYKRWLKKLPLTEAHSFKKLFVNDPELAKYVCEISQEIIRLPACLPCHHVFNYEHLTDAVSRYGTCPEPYCRKPGKKDEIQLAPELFDRMNTTFLSIMKHGLAGKVLTPTQHKGFLYLQQDLEQRSYSVYERVVAEVTARAETIMSSPRLDSAGKILELQKGKDALDTVFNMRMKILKAMPS